MKQIDECHGGPGRSHGYAAGFKAAAGGRSSAPSVPTRRRRSSSPQGPTPSASSARGRRSGWPRPICSPTAVRWSGAPWRMPCGAARLPRRRRLSPHLRYDPAALGHLATQCPRLLPPRSGPTGQAGYRKRPAVPRRCPEPVPGGTGGEARCDDHRRRPPGGHRPHQSHPGGADADRRAQGDRPEIMKGSDFYALVRAAMIMDRSPDGLPPRGDRGGAGDRTAPASGRFRPPEKRLILSGGVCNHPDIYTIVEEAGGAVVGDDLCTGARCVQRPHRREGRPIAAIAARYRERVVCPAKHRGSRSGRRTSFGWPGKSGPGGDLLTSQILRSPCFRLPLSQGGPGKGGDSQHGR